MWVLGSGAMLSVCSKTGMLLPTGNGRLVVKALGSMKVRCAWVSKHVDIFEGTRPLLVDSIRALWGPPYLCHPANPRLKILLQVKASIAIKMPYLFDTDRSSRSLGLKTMNALRDLPLAKTCLAVLACWSIFATARTLIKAYRSPLSDVPGPWIARFTRFWLLRAINTRSWEKINIRLHREHGEYETPVSYTGRLLW